MAKTRKQANPRLPNAPLAEVVFELRWQLQRGQPADLAVLQTDPGLLPLLDKFTAGIKRAGFVASKDMSPPLQTGGYGIARRHYLAHDKPFPIMQVGPGIFATNESADYEWTQFKKQIAQGIRVLLKSYPKIEFFPLHPIQLELRYVDVFDKSILGKAALFHFIKQGTDMNIELPKMLADSKVFSGDAIGRFIFQSALVGMKDSTFILDLGSGNNVEKGDVVRMETKVVTKAGAAPKLSDGKRFLREVDKWLEFAHSITSPMFRELINDKVVSKFRQ